MRWNLYFLLLACAALTVGCERSSPPVANNEPVAAPPAAQPATVTPAKSAANLDYWDVHFIGSDRVGYSHSTTQVEGQGEAARVRNYNQTELTIKRFGQTISQVIELESTELTDGTPLNFRNVAKSGAQVMTESAGVWEDGKLKIVATTLGKRAELSIAWQPNYGGPFADVQSLRSKPLQPGEARTITALVPSLNQIAETAFTAKEREKTKLLDSEAELLRVEAVVNARTPQGVVQIASTYWLNAEGEVLKSYLPQLQQTSYRTTKEVATAKSTGGSFDLAEATIVKLAKPLRKPHDAKSIVYKATLPGGKIDGVFIPGPTQRIKLLDKHTCELTIHAVRPGEPAQLDEPDTQPTKADLAPNTLVQSDDDLVLRLAHSAAEREEDPWKIATALETLVHRAVNKKNFTQTFATAAEVAKSREGDCTEHAVLLAALCRARGIPARCAMGLVYYPQAQGFAYHMWTEVWIVDRWVPLDATLGRGGIGAGHLKLAHANLEGADAYSAFLPVFRVLGQLKLEVVDAN